MPPPIQHSDLLVDNNNASVSFLSDKVAGLIPSEIRLDLVDIPAKNPEQDQQAVVDIGVDYSHEGKKENHSVGNRQQDTQQPGRTSVCLGRVTDLEAMVPPAWWKSVFADEMYLKTDGDVVEDADITLSEVRALEADPTIQAVLAKGRKQEDATKENKARILDLCCGQGRHTLLLAELYPGLEIHGLDQSEFLIQLARSRADTLATNNPKVLDRISFTIGDCRSIPHPDNSISLVLLMGNSFGYFASDNADRMVLQEISRVLRPGGVIALDVVDGAYMRDNFNPRSWEWIDDNMLVCRERQLSKDRRRLVSREVVIMADKGVARDQFYQERLYDRHELSELMLEVGLQTANPNEKKLVTGQDSKRGEDLGMMGQRDFVVAFKPL